jgi:hypothetical protein
LRSQQGGRPAMPSTAFGWADQRRPASRRLTHRYCRERADLATRRWGTVLLPSLLRGAILGNSDLYMHRREGMDNAALAPWQAVGEGRQIRLSGRLHTPGATGGSVCVLPIRHFGSTCSMERPVCALFAVHGLVARLTFDCHRLGVVSKETQALELAVLCGRCMLKKICAVPRAKQDFSPDWAA